MTLGTVLLIIGIAAWVMNGILAWRSFSEGRPGYYAWGVLHTLVVIVLGAAMLDTIL